MLCGAGTVAAAGDGLVRTREPGSWDPDSGSFRVTDFGNRIRGSNRRARLRHSLLRREILRNDLRLREKNAKCRCRQTPDTKHLRMFPRLDIGKHVSASRIRLKGRNPVVQNAGSRSLAKQCLWVTACRWDSRRPFAAVRAARFSRVSFIRLRASVIAGRSCTLQARSHARGSAGMRTATPRSMRAGRSRGSFARSWPAWERGAFAASRRGGARLRRPAGGREQCSRAGGAVAARH